MSVHGLGGEEGRGYTSAVARERERLLDRVGVLMDVKRQGALGAYLGGFERAHCREMNNEELHQFEVILSQPEESLRDWLLEGAKAPFYVQGEVFATLMRYVRCWTDSQEYR